MEGNSKELASLEEDVITLKDLILKLQEFYREVWQHWKLIVIIAIPIVLFMVYRSISEPPIYSAKLTFMVNEDEGGGGISGLSSILGSFGFGGRSGGKYNLERILELSLSQNIIQQAIFEKVNIDGEEDYLANHIVKVYNFHDRWKDNENYPELATFLFTQDSVPLFGTVERIVLKSVYGKIVGSAKVVGIFTRSVSEDSGIMSMKVSSENEMLSIELVKAIFDKLSKFYVNKTTERNATTYKVVKHKADSILNLLVAAEARLARFKDQNRGLYLMEAQLEQQQLERKVTQYSIMYGEALKNQETSDFVLKNQTPFVQEIDVPFAPIQPVKGSLLMALIKGGFLGGFLAVGFIVFRKIIRDAMEEEEGRSKTED